MFDKELYDLQIRQNVKYNKDIPFNMFITTCIGFLQVDSIVAEQMYVIYKYSNSKCCTIKSNILKKEAEKIISFFKNVGIHITLVNTNIKH